MQNRYGANDPIVTSEQFPDTNNFKTMLITNGLDKVIFERFFLHKPGRVPTVDDIKLPTPNSLLEYKLGFLEVLAKYTRNNILAEVLERMILGYTTMSLVVVGEQNLIILALTLVRNNLRESNWNSTWALRLVQNDYVCELEWIALIE